MMTDAPVVDALSEARNSPWFFIGGVEVTLETIADCAEGKGIHARRYGLDLMSAEERLVKIAQWAREALAKVPSTKAAP